jgi:signal transduction histidine kinase
VRTSTGRYLQKLTGPRPGLLLGSAALVLALLGSFAYVIVDSQAESRREAERRFAVGATSAAELTTALFVTAAEGTQRNAAKAYGGRAPDENALAAQAKKSGWRYALIVGSDGKVLAATPGTPAAVRRAVSTAPHIRSALAGRPVLSDVRTAGKGRTIEWALPFKTRFGRRVQVQGFNADLLSRFLGGYLRRTHGDDTSAGYLLDSRNHIVAWSGGAPKIGEGRMSPSFLAALNRGSQGSYQEGGVERYFTSWPVEGSTWRVLVTDSTSRLYPTLAGSHQWFLYLVLAGFALAGGLSIFFLRRALVSDAQLAERNRQLAEANATLEARVAERTAALEARAGELARSNAELEQFASVASHDLQEPLRKISMFSDRLRTRLGNGIPGEAASDLERVENAAQRMKRLIDDLLSFSRVASKESAPEPVDLGRVTQEVLGDLEARIVELDASIDLGDLPVVEADRVQMRQLMQNLVSNALKFHREGEPPVVRIHGDVIRGHSPRFEGEAPFRDRCVITVEDNGIGFDEKYAERVFAPFERLHSRMRYDGTGIGLAIARKIVWRHGGDIEAKSSPGEGSKFMITLPLGNGNGAGSHER